MNIFYTCDDKFVCFAGISMVSICENNRDMDVIDFYLLGDNISDNNKQALSGLLIPYGRTISVIDVPQLDVPRELCNQRWPRSAYTRLFSGTLLPNTVKTALYLDCDTIIVGSLKELDIINSKYAVCGVKDCISGYYKENIGLEKDTLYINAGVLLMNLTELRKMDMNKSISDFFNAYSKTMFFADQDVLNGIFKGNVGVLEPKYDMMTIHYSLSYKELIKIRRPSNYYSKEELEKAKKNPSIVHFTTFMTNIRPWIEGADHPYTKDFEKYMAMTPWRNMEKQARTKHMKDKRIMAYILLAPKFLAYPILGFLHSVVRPLLKRRRK